MKKDVAYLYEKYFLMTAVPTRRLRSLFQYIVIPQNNLTQMAHVGRFFVRFRSEITRPIDHYQCQHIKDEAVRIYRRFQISSPDVIEIICFDSYVCHLA